MSDAQEPSGPCAAEMLHGELVNAINRARAEGDLSVVEMLGVLRLVEEDVITWAKPD